jgi:MFS family permease
VRGSAHGASFRGRYNSADVRPSRRRVKAFPRSDTRPAASGALRAGAVVVAGLTSAIHIGKLPAALPVLQADFGLSLVQVSWMVSLFMLGPALVGGIAGSLADRFDARRTMITGLLLSAATSAFGAFASSPASLFASRALESVSYLMTVLPAPALISRLVPRAQVRGWLGAWSAYMPAGMGIALLSTPALMAGVGWRGVWLVCAALSILAAALVALVHPTADSEDASAGAARVRIGPLVRQTLHSRGPWLLALCFLFYAGQFTAIFSFLPSIYQDAGLSPQWSASLTAAAVMISMSGNLAAGFLLQHGVSRSTLVAFGGLAMATCAWLAFGSSFGFASRYAGILLFAASAGFIPGTLFATVPFYAPSQDAISTTVGMMQQGSSIGQLLLPPAVAALAQYAGGWQTIWIATGAAAMVTVAIGLAMRRYEAARRRPG